MSCLSTLLIVSFDIQRFLISMKSKLSIFFFRCRYFWCHIQEITDKSTVLKFFPKHFIVLVVIFRSSIHFELILVYRGPQSPGRGLLPVHGLLGTGLQSRRWVVGERAKLLLPLSIARITSWTVPLPCPFPPTPRWGEILASRKPVPSTKKVGDRCCIWYKIRVQFHFFACGYHPVFPITTCWKYCFFMATVIENHLTIYLRIYFWAILFYWSVCLW